MEEVIKPTWNKGLRTGTEIKCLACESIIYQYPSEKRKYCSKKCRSTHVDYINKMSEVKKGKPSGVLGKHWKLSEESKKNISNGHKGEKSYLWKGGITSQNRLERVKFRIKLQKKIFERDNYTCQDCGKRGGFLQVDHIKSWSDYPESRFEIDNCRTLCMSCHYRKTFGVEMPLNIETWGHNLKKKIYV